LTDHLFLVCISAAYFLKSGVKGAIHLNTSAKKDLSKMIKRNFIAVPMYPCSRREVLPALAKMESAMVWGVVAVDLKNETIEIVVGVL